MSLITTKDCLNIVKITSSILLTLFLFCLYRVKTVLVPSKFLNSDYTFKTGDILLTSYSGHRSTLSSIFYNSIWVHPSLIVVKDDKTFVLEGAMYKEKQWSSPIVLIPFDIWKRKNSSAFRIGLKRISTSLNEDKLLSIKDEMLNRGVKVEDFSLRWITFYSKKRRKNTSTNLACHEVFIEILQSMKVYSSEFSSDSFTPGDIAEDKIGLTGGYSFGEIEII